MRTDFSPESQQCFRQSEANACCDASAEKFTAADESGHGIPSLTLPSIVSEIRDSTPKIRLLEFRSLKIESLGIESLRNQERKCSPGIRPLVWRRES